MAWMAKTIAWMAGALLIGLIGSFAWGRLRPPSEVQAQAMAILKPVPAPTGVVNAWATFWLLDYDIPTAQIDATYVQEREQLEAWARLTQTDNSPNLSYDNSAGEHFPKRPAFSAAQSTQLCSANDPDCLGRVRANLQPLRELLASQAGRLAQLRAIPPDAVLWDDMPHTVNTPLPALSMAGNLRLTAAALDFADGRKVQALAQVCRDARTVRHLHAHTNSLVGAMVTNSWMYSIERLLADMLTELPSDQPIPEDCAVAFAPVTRADVEMCAPMQREYQSLQNVIANVVPDPSHRVRRFRMQVLLDIEHSRRLTAPTYGWACRPAVIDSMLGDRPLSSLQVPGVGYDFFDTLSNPIGLILARIVGPDYAKYLNRNEDYAASLRAMAWLLTNRATASTPADWRRQFASARSALQQKGSRDVRLDAAAKHLIMPYTETRPHHHELVLSLTK